MESCGGVKGALRTSHANRARLSPNLIPYLCDTLVKGQEPTMHIGLDAAVEIYAKACRAWYGRRARKVVLERASELFRSGDLEGSRVWQRVAAELDNEVPAKSN